MPRLPLGDTWGGIARADKGMKPQIVAEIVNYKNQMLAFMPGRRTVDKERAFFAIFSTMFGATEMARILSDPAVREKVLRSAREFLFAQFLGNEVHHDPCKTCEFKQTRVWIATLTIL